LLLTARSIGKPFSRVKGDFLGKAGVDDVVGRCILIDGGPSGVIGFDFGRLFRQAGISAFAGTSFEVFLAPLIL